MHVVQEHAKSKYGSFDAKKGILVKQVDVDTDVEEWKRVKTKAEYDDALSNRKAYYDKKRTMSTYYQDVNPPDAPEIKGLSKGLEYAGHAANGYAIATQAFSLLTGGIPDVATALDTAAQAVVIAEYVAESLEKAQSATKAAIGAAMGKATKVLGPALDIAIGIYELATINFYETSTTTVVFKSIAFALTSIGAVLAPFAGVGVIIGAIGALVGLFADLFAPSRCDVIRNNLNDRSIDHEPFVIAYQDMYPKKPFRGLNVHQRDTLLNGGMALQTKAEAEKTWKMVVKEKGGYKQAGSPRVALRFYNKEGVTGPATIEMQPKSNVPPATLASLDAFRRIKRLYVGEFAAGNDNGADDRVYERIATAIKTAAKEARANDVGTDADKCWAHKRCKAEVCKLLIKDLVQGSHAVRMASSEAKGLLTGAVFDSEEMYGQLLLRCYKITEPRTYDPNAVVLATPSDKKTVCPAGCPGCVLFGKVVSEIGVTTLLDAMEGDEDENLRKMLGSCGQISTDDDDETRTMVNAACSCFVAPSGCPTAKEVKAGGGLHKFKLPDSMQIDEACDVKIDGTSHKVYPLPAGCQYKHTTPFAHEGKGRCDKNNDIEMAGNTIKGLTQDIHSWPADFKHQVLNNLFEGTTSDDDEAMILKVWHCTSKIDREALKGKGWTFQKFEGAIEGEEWNGKGGRGGMKNCYPIDMASAAGDDDFARLWLVRTSPEDIQAEVQKANAAERFSQLLKAMFDGATGTDDEKAIARVFTALSMKGELKHKGCEVMRDLLLTKLDPTAYDGDVNWRLWKDVDDSAPTAAIRKAKELCMIPPQNAEGENEEAWLGERISPTYCSLYPPMILAASRMFLGTRTRRRVPLVPSPSHLSRCPAYGLWLYFQVPLGTNRRGTTATMTSVSATLVGTINTGRTFSACAIVIAPVMTRVVAGPVTARPESG